MRAHTIILDWEAALKNRESGAELDAQRMGESCLYMLRFRYRRLRLLSGRNKVKGTRHFKLAEAGEDKDQT